MAAFGRIEQFDNSVCDIETYIERFDQICKANEIEDDSDIKISGFLAVIGPKTYILLKSLVAPAKPDTKTYDELKSVLTTHLSPKPLTISERFRFYRRNQREGETISQYIAELQKLANTCEFGTFLSQALRDRLVCGLRSEAIQRKLLSEFELNLNKAKDIAIGMELADKNARELKASGTLATPSVRASDETVNKVTGSRRTNERSRRQARDTPALKCYRCGYKNHTPVNCRYKNFTCNSCGKTGHLKSECKTKQLQKTRHVEETCEDDVEYISEEVETIGLFHTRENGSIGNMKVTLNINNEPLCFEVDTGSPATIIPQAVFKKKFPHVKLKDAKTVLKGYSGVAMPLSGQTVVDVRFEGVNHKLTLIVADVDDNIPILGRRWIKELKLNLSDIFDQCVNSLSEDSKSNEKCDINTVLEKHQTLFENKLGEIKGTVAEIKLKQDSQPKFMKARPVPYALRKKVEAELDKLEADGVISKIKTSDWATPIVIVPKASGDIRICGDYKVTLNQCIEIDKHPLPKPADLFATFAGSEVFSKVDLTKAFHQLRVSEETKKLLVVNTHRGLYCYNRLPFGIASCPAIFQQVMERILQGIDKTVTFQDDIEIGGKTPEEHIKLLDAVLTRLEEHGIKVRREKCQFMQPQVKYLGHMIDKDGLHTIPDKVKAILDAPEPTNKTQLRSFLGMVQYYSRFIPRLSTLVHPLNELLKKSEEWKWTNKCQCAFNEAKDKLASVEVLTHFDLNLPIKLACDASSYGLGAVISHVMPDGSERPIAYASRTLSASEKNYAQIEKEALGLIFGVKRFHEYLYGQKFTLVTDHKPLLSILGPKKQVPTLAAARMQRWALILAAYTYDIEFRKTEEHGNADLLSRLPLENDDGPEECNIFHFTYVDDLPVTARDIQDATRKDGTLSRVLDFTYNGWPSHVNSPELKPYFTRRNELSVEDGVLLWGLRVIIPPTLRERILSELHADHLGMVRMKGLSRSYFWWPALDADIESIVRSCTDCISTRNMPCTVPVHEWTFPSKPWKRVHVDFAEFKGRMYFILIDAYSKWPEVYLMNSTTTTKTIEVLRHVFATHGIPSELVSDNGPQFISEEFKNFMKMNGVTHKRSPPYHPSTNGQAERFVQVLKNYLKTSKVTDPQRQLSTFLFSYRTTPHTVTGRPPSELLMKRQLRSRFDLIKPSLSDRMTKQNDGHIVSETHGKLRDLIPGQSVAIRRFRGPNKWVQGTVMQRLGPVSYIVDIDGYPNHVHIDHMIRAPDAVDSTTVEPVTEQTVDARTLEQIVTPTLVVESTSSSAVETPQANDIQTPTKITPMLESSDKTSAVERRYPLRDRRPPMRLDL